MTAKEVLEKYNTEISTLKELLEIKTYVPLAMKKKVIEVLIGETIVYKGSIATFDSINKKLNLELAIISLYTNLDLGNAYEDYDTLKESGLLEMIRREIGADLFEFRNLFEDKCRDILRESNALESIVDNSLQEVVMSINITLEKVNKTLEKADSNTVTKLIDGLEKKLEKFKLK